MPNDSIKSLGAMVPAKNLYATLSTINKSDPKQTKSSVDNLETSQSDSSVSTKSNRNEVNSLLVAESLSLYLSKLIREDSETALSAHNVSDQSINLTSESTDLTS
jgi:hypothetical protein